MPVILPNKRSGVKDQVEHMFAFVGERCYGSLVETITTRQRRILDFIKRTVQERGYPPTVREIGEAVGLTSSSSVHAQLANLERRGLLRRDATKPRAMELKGPGAPRRAQAVTVPLIGRVAAGAPVMADEGVEDYLVVPSGYATEGDHFALRVVGDSMINAGIFEGDVVIVKRQDAADEGDIVAALLPGPAEEEATIKRFHRRRGHIQLVPENPRMKPIEMTDGQILGKVVAVLRKL